MTTFDYYLSGIKYTQENDITETIADEEGLWVFYIDAEGSIASIKNPSHAQIEDAIMNYTLIAYVYWDATNGEGRLMDERHLAQMAPATHHWIHETFGSAYYDGMAVGDVSADENGSLDVHAQFSVSEGTFYDEDITHTVTAVSLTDATIEVWYYNGSAWRWESNTGFAVLSYSGGSGRLAYNDGGVQTEVDNGKYVLCHVYATNVIPSDDGDAKYIAFQGTAQYSTLASAREGADTEVNALQNSNPFEEFIPVATLIFQTNTGYGNSVKARIVTAPDGSDYIDWRGERVSGTGGSIQDHGGLAGLSDDDHQQYALVDGTRSVATLAVDDLTEDRLVVVGVSGELEDDANLTWDGSTFSVTGSVVATVAATLGSAKVSDLTAGRVVFAGTDGELEDSANLTWDELDLSVTGGIKVSDLTDGRIVIAGVDGQLGDDANLTWDGADLTVGGGILTSDLTDGRVVLAGTGGQLEDSLNLTFDGSTLAITGSLTVSVAATLASAAVSDLTSGRVVLAGTSGELEDNGNLTFNGTVLAVTGSITASVSATLASAAVSDLTAGRVVTVGTSGELQDDADLTFDGATLTAGGILLGATTLDFQDSAGLIYGSAFDYTNDSITLTNSSTWYEMTDAYASSGALNGVTVSSHEIVVPSDGVYYVEYSVSVYCNGSNQNIDIGVLLNSNTGAGSINGMLCNLALSGSTITAHSSTTISLSANDTLSLGATNYTSGGYVIYFARRKMTVIKIGD